MNTRNGQDSKGRLHHNSAIAILLDTIEQDGGSVNTWDAAEAAVERADDETVRAALRGLLALHLFNLANEYPQVAMRNVRVDDVVLLSGVPHTVIEKTDRGDKGQTVYLKARFTHNPDSGPQTFINDRDVRISLIARPGA